GHRRGRAAGRGGGPGPPRRAGPAGDSPVRHPRARGGHHPDGPAAGGGRLGRAAVPYVIVDACTRDGSCVEVCPVACIHTTPDAPQYYIDPDVCIECEQCVLVCPVDAIYIDRELPEHWL